jgi:hypothetical protein
MVFGARLAQSGHRRLAVTLGCCARSSSTGNLGAQPERFFQSFPGNLVPDLLVVVSSIVVFLRRLVTRRHWNVIFTGLAVSGSCLALGVARLAQRDNCQSPLFVGYAPVFPISALIHQAGGLPKSSVEIQPGPALPASIRTYPVTDWNLNSVHVADSRPLWESIRDDDPTYSVKMEL